MRPQTIYLPRPFKLNNRSNQISQDIKSHAIERGFTLIELVVVVAIIGILGAIGVPIYNGYITSAAETDAKNTLRVISAAQERFRLLNGAYYPNPVGTQASATIISTTLLNGQPLNTRYYSFTVQTNNCGVQPNTGIARQFCAIARRNNSAAFFIIDHTDKIYNQLNQEVQ